MRDQKQPAEMSAAEKLLRLRELVEATRTNVGISNDLTHSPEVRAEANAAARVALAEHDLIISTVHLPPLELMGDYRADRWAQAFAAQFPTVRADDVYAWFANAINSNAQNCYNEGNVDGYAKGAQDSAAVLAKLGEILSTIKEGIAAGQIVCRSTLMNLETRKARSFEEYIAEGLQLVGR